MKIFIYIFLLLKTESNKKIGILSLTYSDEYIASATERIGISPDSLRIVIESPYHNEQVIILLSNKEIYNHKVTHSLITGVAGFLEIPYPKDDFYFKVGNFERTVRKEEFEGYNYVYISYNDITLSKSARWYR